VLRIDTDVLVLDVQLLQIDYLKKSSVETIKTLVGTPALLLLLDTCLATRLLLMLVQSRNGWQELDLGG